MLIRDPEVARGPTIVGDRGGNGLLFPDGTNVHAVWDGCLVDRVSGNPCAPRSAEYTPLARMLASRMVSEGAAFHTTGGHHAWPEQWATDSLRTAVASDAYPTKLTHGTVKTGRADERYLEATIVAPALQPYVASRTQAASQQLLKAAVRLADLLNAVAWR
jgi:hypothetical protein